MTDETIFAEALEKADPAERSAFLDGACRADPEQRRRLEALLAAHDRAAGFLERPPVAALDPDAASTRAFAAPGDTRTHGEEANGSAADDDALAFLSPPGRPDSLGRIGHYEVLEVLGRGGFGIVFRAFDEVLQRVVAVKVLAPPMAATSPARKRFLREARAAAQIDHPNVVKIYGTGEAPLPYLVMEFIPGETLQQRLDRTGPLDFPEVVSLGRQVAEGLAAAHAAGRIHRDIKPANVMVDAGPHGRVKITDFGLARAADDASISQSGVVAGTPMYMAPEQARGDALDHRADLFSLGSVLYALLTGRPPFRAETTLAVLKRVADDTPRPIREVIPEVPDWLCRVVEKLHAKNPDDRYQTAREVADLLADCEAQLKAHGAMKDFSRVPEARPSPPDRSPAVRGLSWDVVLLCALIGVSFAVYLFKDLVVPKFLGEWEWLWVGNSLFLAVIAVMIYAVVRRVRTPPGDRAETPPRWKWRWAAAPVLLVPLAAWGVYSLTRPAQRGGDAPRTDGPPAPGSDWPPLAVGPTDLIPLARPDLSSGRWEVRDGKLVHPRRGEAAFPALPFAVRAPDEYDLEAEFERTEGGDFIGFGMSAYGHRFQVAFDTFKRWAGVQSVDGNWIDKNPTRRQGPWLTTGKRHVFRCEVRESGIRAWLDGREAVDYRGGYAALSAGLPDMPDWVRFYVQANDDCGFVIHKFVLTPRATGPTKDGFVPLFNGKDLSGWKTHPAQPGDWKAEGGEIVGRGVNSGTAFLFSESGNYANFHLRVEAKVNATGDSGVFFRTPFDVLARDTPSKFSLAAGYEAQVAVRSNWPVHTGSLALAFAPSAAESILQKGPLNPHRPDEWFVLEVIAEGNHIRTLVNGKPAADFRDESRRFSRGHLALQAWGGPATTVHVRKVEIKELPPPPPEVPKTAADVLPFMAGTWKAEWETLTPKQPPGTAPAADLWVFDSVADGRVVRGRILEDTRPERLTFYRFDPAGNTLSQWVAGFGPAVWGPQVGVFNPENRTLTLRFKLPDRERLNNFTFVDPDTMTARLFLQDEKNAVAHESRATLTRVKGPVALPAAPAGAVKRPAEMEVLDRLLGGWREELTVTDAAAPDKPKRETVRVKAESVLGGLFVEVFETNETKNTSDYWLTWFDTNRKQYRTLYFGGDGTVGEPTATWDEATKTLTWVSPDRTVEGRYVFTGDDRREVTYLVKDKDGKVLNKAEGVSRRTASRFAPLFNGKDLTGWSAGPDAGDLWKVEGGSVVGRGAGPRMLHNPLATTRTDFADFHLRLEARYVTGEGVLVVRQEPGKPGTGYAVYMNNKTGNFHTGAMMTAAGAKAQTAPQREEVTKPGEWFTLEVIAKGNRFQTLVNGKQVVDFTDADRNYAAGLIRVGGAGPDAELQFREIEIKEFPPEKAAAGTPGAFTNNLGMEFALVPKGRAWLGGGGGRAGTREVEFKEDFYLGVYEVTQEEWEKVLGKGNNPSAFSRAGGNKERVKDVPDADLKRFPVDNLSWHDCREFVTRLNEKVREAGWVYRMPTEDEWEYACRGGPSADKDDYSFDFYFDRPTNSLQPDKANFLKTNLGRTDKVSASAGNRLGLYGFHGNVWEWCDDQLPPDAQGVPQRAHRGGCFVNNAEFCTAASRIVAPPTHNDDGIGLRLARVPVRVAAVAPPPRPVSAAPQPPPAPPKFDETKAENLQKAWARHLGREVEVENSVGMKLRLIPPGEFTMGSDDKDDNLLMVGPAHRAKVTAPFYVGAHEVTRGQYDAVVKPAKPSAKDALTLPVTNVTWHDAVELCKKLGERDEEKKAGRTYRLVSDVEFEYACRAGTTGPYYFGRMEDVEGFAWFADNSGGKAQVVGGKKPNAWGLYDVIGNVHEWCQDSFEQYKAGDVEHDPNKPIFGVGPMKVLRSSNYRTAAKFARSTSRAAQDANFKSDFIGFRVVMLFEAKK